MAFWDSRKKKGEESKLWVLLETGSFPSNQIRETRFLGIVRG